MEKLASDKDSGVLKKNRILWTKKFYNIGPRENKLKLKEQIESNQLPCIISEVTNFTFKILHFLRNVWMGPNKLECL